MKNVYCITGPTASGKTEHAVRLAKHLKGELISADSRQIYKGMTIGTGAPILKNGSYRGVRHHLIGTVKPNKIYSVYDFQKDAYRLIEQIKKRGNIPIIVGGTGLWIRALKEGLNFQETKPDSKLRKQLEKELKMKGLKNLVKKLKTLNKYFTIDFKNPRRVVRALEIALSNKDVIARQVGAAKPASTSSSLGGPASPSSQGGQSSNHSGIRENLNIGRSPRFARDDYPLTFKTIHLSTSKQTLNKRIDKRVDDMVKKGLVKEVVKLLKKYKLVKGRLPRSARNDNIHVNESKLKRYSALTGIGYREIIDHLEGQTTLSEAIDLIKLHTRQYAKRQMTWFKKYH